LEQEKALYQNDPARKAQIELKQATLLSKISDKDVDFAKLDVTCPVFPDQFNLE
jgi:hypothetical protein